MSSEACATKMIFCIVPVLRAGFQGLFDGSTPRLAMICCGNRSDETLVLLKSAFLFSQHANVVVFIIADPVCRPILADGV